MPATIPETHPRRESLLVRERLARGFGEGLVAAEGLMAHGRGEAFDYIIGERTRGFARAAVRAAAAILLLAERPAISVNGNVAALCPGEAAGLARATGAVVEVNMFYADAGDPSGGTWDRRRKAAAALARAGAREVLGASPESAGRLPGTDSERGTADVRGALAADVVLVALEDGDRAAALAAAGKTVIAIDLNPLSRTAAAAHVTIVDNVVRCMGELAAECGRLSGNGREELEGARDSFDNAANLASAVRAVAAGLEARAAGAGTA